ncbi:MAG TPA: 50S ribosomal protein L18 [Patescibacteria group bacterium]|nr:50S ribosomal protein L18 [Patescibacteria group bacterium]
MHITRNARIRKARKVRMKIRRMGDVLRLSVFRSSKYIYAQVIDDKQGKTLVACSDTTMKFPEKLTKTEKARRVGREIAEKMKKLKITKVVFDRGPYMYEGRVKHVAEGAREGGITL